MGPLAGLEAMVLAGGLGTRIRPVLGSRPKVLASIDGVPFLDRLLSTLASEGLTRAILCLGYGADDVIRHLSGRSTGRLEIATSIDSDPLGTGGALRQALPHARAQTLLALNGDTFLDLEWTPLVRLHRETRSNVTIACVHALDRSRMGAVECDPDGHVLSVAEKDPNRTGPGWASAGTYLLERYVIEAIPSGRSVSLEREVLPAWVGRGLWAYRGVRRVHDIGTPEGLMTAHERWGGPIG